MYETNHIYIIVDTNNLDNSSGYEVYLSGYDPDDVYIANTVSLINRAIESAKCRIYRLKQNPGTTEEHQIKAKNKKN